MNILLIVTGLTGLWDGFTTFYGVSQIMGTTKEATIASAFFAFIIAGFLFGTKTIWDIAGNNLLSIILKLLWFIALSYDIYTSFYGNKTFILNGQGSEEQMIILIGMTLLVSGSPIIYSYIQKY